LYARYADRVASFFGRKTSADVPDLVQRTFLKLFEAAKAGVEIGRVDAMLFTIARNELYDSFRRARREGDPFDPDAMTLEDQATRASQLLARREEQTLLLQALRRLPLDDQLALELYYWEELPMEEVARVLGATKSAAINRVHRARGALKAVLERLEARPELVRETISDLEGWAKSLKDLAK
ncbi:MAG TPA: sigma-70 family RNA polymerase sigma factor, partial [Actinomycetota bacterium]|nr:sigma-70 family RNA polymerase sigma factor [Actinomycetota bacterium]